MKYKTKQKRLIALIEIYQKVKNVTQFDASKVAEWAMDNQLYPVPVGCTQDEAEEWEAQLSSMLPETDPDDHD